MCHVAEFSPSAFVGFFRKTNFHRMCLGFHSMLYIWTSIWVLRTSNKVSNWLFQRCSYQKAEKGEKSKIIDAKNMFFEIAPECWLSVLADKNKIYGVCSTQMLVKIYGNQRQKEFPCLV